LKNWYIKIKNDFREGEWTAAVSDAGPQTTPFQSGF
jgi:hypothetical protein